MGGAATARSGPGCRTAPATSSASARASAVVGGRRARGRHVLPADAARPRRARLAARRHAQRVRGARPLTASCALPDGIGYEAAACLPCAGVTAWHALFARRPADRARRYRAGARHRRRVDAGAAARARCRRAGRRHVVERRQAGARPGARRHRRHQLHPHAGVGRGGPAGHRRPRRRLRRRDRRRRNAGALVPRRSRAAERWCSSASSAARRATRRRYPLMMKGGSLHGVFVGDRPMFEALLRAVAVNRIEPAIDRVFGFDRGRRPPTPITRPARSSARSSSAGRRRGAGAGVACVKGVGVGVRRHPGRPRRHRTGAHAAGPVPSRRDGWRSCRVAHVAG